MASTHTAPNVRAVRREGAIQIILAFALMWLVAAGLLGGAEPPDDLLRRVLERETAAAALRGNYLYKQKVLIEELDTRGLRRGDYREEREVIFTPEGARHERVVRGPFRNLHRLQLTEEDFEDIRNIQPFLFTTAELHIYQTTFRGEETVEDIPCWVLQVRPRQILYGQRLFDGMVWVSQSDYAVVRLEGRAAPQQFGRKEENLFPRFTTIRRKVDGEWFPALTLADDILPFRNGPLRMRMRIEYEDYRRFGADSTIRFGDPQ